MPFAWRLNSLLRALRVREVPGIDELFAALHAKGTATYLVSGGFREVSRTRVSCAHVAMRPLRVTHTARRLRPGH